MWIIIGFIVYVYLLSKPLYSVSEHFFWTSMELASVRDPLLHEAFVMSMTGERVNLPK